MDIRKLIGAAALGLLAGCMEPTTEALNVQDLQAQTVGYDHWDVQGRFRTRDNVSQNVSQPDLVALLSGNTFVGYEESDGVGGGYGAISIAYYSATGSQEGCILSYRTGQPRDDAYGAKEWASITAEYSLFNAMHPLLRITEFAGHFTYSNVQYNGQTGQIAMIGAFDRNWRDIRKGHLQAGIPAAVYTACPEFPSAASLGTFVNPNQTSWNYFELVQQDQGQRIRRPDLVTPFTAVPMNQSVEVTQ